MKLDISAFALAFGIWWGGGIFVLTWWLIFLGATPDEMSILNDMYPGYAITPVGSIVGLIWGFFCAAICGAILAWLYNVLAGHIGSQTKH